MKNTVLYFAVLLTAVTVMFPLASCGLNGKNTSEKSVKTQEAATSENDAGSSAEQTPNGENTEEIPQANSAENADVSALSEVGTEITASGEMSAEISENGLEVPAKESAYSILCDYIRTNGTDDNGYRRIMGNVNGMPVILELDAEENLIWSCVFEEEQTTSWFAINVGETNETNRVSMTMIKNETGDIVQWNGTLTTSTFVIGDFNAVEIIPDSGTTLTDTEKTAFVINTQITVLGADDVFEQLGLGINASDFGFDIGEEKDME